jgi:hypothetical protein
VAAVCVDVLVDETVEAVGLGFLLGCLLVCALEVEGTWDNGRSVVAVVRDVTVDFARECPG